MPGLKVVQLLPALDTGGVERGTMEIAEALVRRGHCSIVISAGGRMVKQLINNGSRHLQLDIGKKSPFSLRHIPRLCRYFREHDVDIIHARSRLPAWLGYLCWKNMHPHKRPRFITTVHGAYSVNPYSKVMTKGEFMIAVSRFIVKYINDNYPEVNKSKVILIYRGISKKEYPYNYRPDVHWQQKWNSDHPHLKNKFILTLPARITRRKGHEDFISILSRLKQHKIPSHGLIVGNTHKNKIHYLHELKEKTRTLGLQKEISFLGHRQDVKEIMAVSDIVLSLSNKPESFGRTALEALSLGTPVIAYRHGGSAEILERMYPQGGININDIESACNKIVKLYQSPVKVDNKNEFTLDKMLDQELSLYERIKHE